VHIPDDPQATQLQHRHELLHQIELRWLVPSAALLGPLPAIVVAPEPDQVIVGQIVTRIRLVAVLAR
jgi:hypothetical protein